MSEIVPRLHYRIGGTTTDIKLYDSLSDVGADYLSLRVNGAPAYAQLGGVGETEASGLRVRKNGVTLAVLKSNRVDLPSGFIAMFAGSCPDGWTCESTFDNKFVRGAASYTGISYGSPTHTHDYERPGADTTPYDDSLKNADGTGFLYANTTHYHGVGAQSITTESAGNEPPYIKVVFCRKD